jgi:hypothetical protein
MAWTSPMTASSGSVLTAAQWNTHVRDNENQTAPALVTQAGQIVVSTGANALAARTPVSATVATSETTTSLSFTTLTTPGPAVTCVTGTQAIVCLYVNGGNNTLGDGWEMGYAVSGATTIAASDPQSVGYVTMPANAAIFISGMFLVALTPGTNTFTCQYLAANGGTAKFLYRKIFVIPL